MHYVYVLQQVPGGRIYLGFTGALRNTTRAATPRRGVADGRLLYYEAYCSEKAAREREAKLKRNRRMQQMLMARLKSHLD
jgi:predicted GIY-YIG superfamily endonuclease